MLFKFRSLLKIHHITLFLILITGCSANVEGSSNASEEMEVELCGIYAKFIIPYPACKIDIELVYDRDGMAFPISYRNDISKEQYRMRAKEICEELPYREDRPLPAELEYKCYQ